MSKPTLSLKRKQLKQFVSQLNAALALSSGEFTQKAQSLIFRIKQLLAETRFFLSKREVKRILGGLALMMSISMGSNAHAQSFAAPLDNPFGLPVSSPYNAVPAFADLDGDGDLDLLVSKDGGVLQYYQNTGTASSPQFGAPQTNPFGISISLSAFFSPAFVDLDADGDQDLMLGASYNGTLRYLENIGTATNPQFAAPVVDPFGIYPQWFGFPAFADLDDDGDYDLLVGDVDNVTNDAVIEYYENTGTAANPQFAAPQHTSFSLVIGRDYLTLALADLDRDGDQDLLVGEFFSSDLQYFENTGTKKAPAFAAPQANPFGLSSSTASTKSFLSYGDLDGDGDKDLLLGKFSGLMQYFENTSPGVGLNETPAFELEMFPNPANTHFELNLNTDVIKVEIMDATGKMVSQHLSPLNRISVESLPTGTYLVKVYNRDEQVVIQKLNKL